MAITLNTFDPLTSLTLFLATITVAAVVHWRKILRWLKRANRGSNEQKLLKRMRDLHHQLCVARGLPVSSDISSISTCHQFTMLLEHAVIDQYGSLVLTYEPWENQLPLALQAS